MNEAMEYASAVAESRAKSLEQAIQRFVDCGVTLDRMDIREDRRQPFVSVLHVDGLPRFTWRLAPAHRG